MPAGGYSQNRNYRIHHHSFCSGAEGGREREGGGGTEGRVGEREREGGREGERRELLSNPHVMQYSTLLQ